VPESHMIYLCNEAATRDAILSQFRRHLIENPQIKQGDAIIIYYAGHGGRVDAPSGWTSSDGKIETICPHDEWMLDLEGNAIPGIPDRTINELLRRLASEKGNNIVRVLIRPMFSHSKLDPWLFRLLFLTPVILVVSRARIRL